MFFSSENNRMSRFPVVAMLVMMFSVMVAVTPGVHAAQSETNEKQANISNGVTQPVYSYEDAIRETVFIESQLDTNMDGEPDRIAADIIRPRETETTDLKVPIIMDASPYYERIGRGNESEIKDPDQDGINEKFPLFYDNYFVPRGYAVVLVDMVGTNNSDGCPTTGGPAETKSVKAVIDWMNGRADAWNAEGEKVTAGWTNGAVGMIGKSYDGTLANGVFATGVEGLETIVPIAAISGWYDYYRYGGISYYRGGPAYLAGAILHAGYDESGVWQEFGEMKFLNPEAVTDPFGPHFSDQSSYRVFYI